MTDRLRVCRAACAIGLFVTLSIVPARADEPAKRSGATALQVVNATDERVEIRVSNALGNATVFLFPNGSGHFEPVPLASGLGDRVVTVRKIGANGTVALPSKVLALGTFDPVDVPHPVLRVILVRTGGEYQIVYQTLAKVDGAAEAFEPGGRVKTAAPDEGQKKAIGEALKGPANKVGGN